MSIVQEASAAGAALYETFTPQASKTLMPDGSIVGVSDGVVTVVEPPDAGRAATYASIAPVAAKYLLPDGSIVDAINTINVDLAAFEKDLRKTTIPFNPDKGSFNIDEYTQFGGKIIDFVYGGQDVGVLPPERLFDAGSRVSFYLAVIPIPGYNTTTYIQTAIFESGNVYTRRTQNYMGNIKITPWVKLETSKLDISDDAQFHMSDTTRLTLQDQAQIKMDCDGSLELSDSAHIEMNGETSFRMTDNATVDIRTNALIRMSNASSISMTGIAEILMSGTGKLILRDAARIDLGEILLEGRPVPEYENGNCLFVNGSRLAFVEEIEKLINLTIDKTATVAIRDNAQFIMDIAAAFRMTPGTAIDMKNAAKIELTGTGTLIIRDGAKVDLCHSTLLEGYQVPDLEYKPCLFVNGSRLAFAEEIEALINPSTGETASLQSIINDIYSKLST